MNVPRTRLGLHNCLWTKNTLISEPPCMLNFKLNVQQVKVESRNTNSLLQPLLMYSTLKNRVLYFTINVSITCNLSFAIKHGWWRLRGIDDIYLVHILQVTYLSCGLQVSHSRRGGGTLKFPPRTYRGGRFGQGQLPIQKIQIFWTQLKTYACPLDFDETIALAFLKATYPQTPYWVHFTFMAQNPIYMFTFIE